MFIYNPADAHKGKTSLSKATRQRVFTEAEARAAADAAKKSTSSRIVDRKYLDLCVRDAAESCGISVESDARCRGAEKPDAVIIVNGKAIVLNIKTGGNFGQSRFPNTVTQEVRYSKDGKMRLANVCTQYWDWDDIAADCDYVVFPLVDRLEVTQDLKDFTAVMPRDEFIEILQTPALTPRGGQVFHITTNGSNGTNCPVIAFQPGPLARLRALLADMIDHGEVNTLQGFLWDIGRD